jgi:hypothetical protein
MAPIGLFDIESWSIPSAMVLIFVVIIEANKHDNHQSARIAQLVERVTSNHEVSGSSPLVSILFLNRFFSFMPIAQFLQFCSGSRSINILT